LRAKIVFCISSRTEQLNARHRQFDPAAATMFA
jgi:hypothetical protein